MQFEWVITEQTGRWSILNAYIISPPAFFESFFHAELMDSWWGPCCLIWLLGEQNGLLLGLLISYTFISRSGISWWRHDVIDDVMTSLGNGPNCWLRRHQPWHDGHRMGLPCGMLMSYTIILRPSNTDDVIDDVMTSPGSWRNCWFCRHQSWPVGTKKIQFRMIDNEIEKDLQLVPHSPII